MQAETLPALIMTRSLVGSLIILISVFAILSAITALKAKPGHVGNPIGRVFGATIIFAIPLAAVGFAGLLASALLIVVGAPSPTYIFILFLALLSLRTAIKQRSDGMHGCTQLVGIVWSSYAIVWSLVSFHATGGLQSLSPNALSLDWLKPPLAALPFALLVLMVAGRKRNLWLFLGAMAFISAAMALCFYPVENGFAESLLPASDWLRFPVAALAIAGLLAVPRLFYHLRLKPEIRRARRRDLKSGLLFVAAVMAAFGLAWAAARAIIGVLA